MSEDQIEIEHHHNPSKFLLDENVKGLARWLRFLGYDTAIAHGADEVVRLETQRSRRCLVTRDAELASQLRHHAILVRSDVVEDQLKTVLKHSPHTTESAWFGRCVECNELLNELSAEEIKAEKSIPDFVKNKPDMHAWHCANCGHSYWKGSHVTRMQGYFNEILTES